MQQWTRLLKLLAKASSSTGRHSSHKVHAISQQINPYSIIFPCSLAIYSLLHAHQPSYESFFLKEVTCSSQVDWQYNQAVGRFAQWLGDYIQGSEVSIEPASREVMEHSIAAPTVRNTPNSPPAPPGGHIHHQTSKSQIILIHKFRVIELYSVKTVPSAFCVHTQNGSVLHTGSI